MCQLAILIIIDTLVFQTAFDILGFTKTEKFDVYKLSAVCMILSQMEFTGHGDVTTAKSVDAGQTLIDLLGYCDAADELYDRFCNPKIKVTLTYSTTFQKCKRCMNVGGRDGSKSSYLLYITVYSNVS